MNDQRKTTATIAGLLSIFTRSEKSLIFASFILRLLLVSFDLAGLALVGISVQLVSGTQISSESITGKLIQVLVNSGLTNIYGVFAFASVVFFVAKAILSLYLNSWLLKTVADIESQRAGSLFIGLTQSRLDTFLKFSDSQIRHGLLNGLESTISKLILSLSVVLSESFLLFAVSIYLCIANPGMFLALLVFFGVVSFSLGAFVSKKNGLASVQGHNAMLKAQNLIDDVLENFKQVRTMGKQKFFIPKFLEYRVEASKSSVVISQLSVLPRYMLEIALMVGFALLIIQRSVLGSGAVEASTVAVFVAGSMRIIASLLPLQGSLNVLKNIQATSRDTLAMQRDFKVPDNAGLSHTIDHNARAPKISLANVSKTYISGANRVLSRVNLEINSGEFVVLEGASGAGKTTLANLILGLQDPSDGTAHIDNIPAPEFLEKHPGLVAYVPQRSETFEGTLAENVALQRELTEPELQGVQKALEKAGLADFVTSLPEGLDTMIESKGGRLSGGQIQRLALARIFYADPKLLVLDESTSALDTETEKIVLDSFAAMRGKVTILAIAHGGRFSQICDRTIRLQDGELI